MNNTQTFSLLSKESTKKQNTVLPWAFPAPPPCQCRSNSDNLLCQLLDSPGFCENIVLFKMRLPSKYNQTYLEILAKGFKLFQMPFTNPQKQAWKKKKATNSFLFLSIMITIMMYFFLESTVWFGRETIGTLLKFTLYGFMDVIWLRAL